MSAVAELLRILFVICLVIAIPVSISLELLPFYRARLILRLRQAQVMSFVPC